MARKNDPLTRLLALAVVFVGIPYALLSIIGSSLRDILGFWPPAKELLSSENAFIGVIAILVILAIVILIGCIRWCVRRRSRRCVTPSQLPDYGQVALPGNPPRDLPDSTTNDCPVVGGTFAREADLEKFLVGSWSRLDFGVPLDFVGQQVSCGDLGIIDLLARDRVTHDYVVIELKKGRADDVVFGQLSRYLGAVEQDRAKVEGVGIHGIIVARRISPRLRAAVSVNAKVSVRRYVWV